MESVSGLAHRVWGMTQNPAVPGCRQVELQDEKEELTP
jgi:hypothetical protein